MKKIKIKPNKTKQPKPRVCEVAQWVEQLAAQTEDLSVITKLNTVKDRTDSTTPDLHTFRALEPIHTNTNKCNKNLKVLNKIGVLLKSWLGI